MSLATLGAVSAATNELPLPDTSSLSLGEVLILSGGGGTTEAVVIRSIASGRNIGATVSRGALGTLRLAHATPTTVTIYDPSGGGGGGGVTVDNGTDPPAAVTTLVAPGADVSTPGTAMLPAGLPSEWVLGNDGELTIPSAVNNGSFLIVQTFGQSGGLQVDFDGGVSISPDDGASRGLQITAPIATQPYELLSVITRGHGDLSIGSEATVTVYKNTGQTIPMVLVTDQAFAPVFRIDADGSVHIKTGTSILADL